MEDRSPEIFGTAILFLILTWVTVGLRVFVRLVHLDVLQTFTPCNCPVYCPRCSANIQSSSYIFSFCPSPCHIGIETVRLHDHDSTCIVQAFGVDDYAMLCTLILFTAYITCQIGGAVHGSGKRRSQMTDENAQIALRYWFFCEVFYTLSTSVLKFAIGFFLLRITVNKIHIWIIRIIMAVSAVLGISYCCVVVFQCKPVSYWWDLDPTHHGKCISASLVANATYVVSALNSFADWVFGTLPIFIVKDLQMKRSVKVVVSTIIGFAAM